MIIFFLLTPLELASLEAMASPGGKGLVYCNEPSVGLHLWTTQEQQRATTLLRCGAHLCSLTHVGLPFISGLIQTDRTPKGLARRYLGDLTSFSLPFSPCKIDCSGGADFIWLNREQLSAAGVNAAGFAGSHGKSHANLHPLRAWPRMFSILIFMSAPSVPVGCILK